MKVEKKKMQLILVSNINYTEFENEITGVRCAEDGDVSMTQTRTKTKTKTANVP